MKKRPKPRARKSTVEATLRIPHDVLMYTLEVATLAGVTHSQAINVILACDIIMGRRVLESQAKSAAEPK
jgi:hypothetical protein